VFPDFLFNELVSKYKSHMVESGELILSSDCSGDNFQAPADGFRDFLATESQNLTLPHVNVIRMFLLRPPLWSSRFQIF
jgi:hypothetical protein